MGKKYFIQQYLFTDIAFYGGVGFVDAEENLEKNGFIPIVFPYQKSFSIWAKICRFLYLISCLFSIEKGSVIVYVHPCYAKMSLLLLKLIRIRKSIKVICLIGDIDGLRDEDSKLLRNEILEFSKPDILIAHNNNMQNWLEKHIEPGNVKIVQLQMFDYNVQPVEIKRRLTPEIVFAGNLSAAQFVLKLNDTFKEESILQYNIFGYKESQEKIIHPHIHYYSYEPDPYKVPMLLNGSFGLIWYGNSLDECSGSTGEYVKYISQHKFSQYIISGLPIIIWEQAATAEFVKKYNIGITIQSIYDIEEKIKAISPDEYNTMRENMKPLAQKLSTGYFIRTAMNESLSKLGWKEN